MPAATGRKPLTEQITMALAQLRAARAQGEIEREFTWQSMLDRLLDRYAQGFR
ncbi:hypothetical protein MSP7336_01784 [Mycobacterium shimoidei]|uniref:Uncharacterized protein n=1 Tax=Mycobacterium shimoidei TaxID=29313 RepID=A0A375YXF6_MYCSH|nr:hypothetical protein [Mycobacterium shimoidei]SRX93546.1 hypothetical protein MSP7336_01784 [Mycobacterium shimoidei]